MAERMTQKIGPEVKKKIVDAALAAERDFSAELTIPMLAEVAGMSDKHFQRCFLAVMGEAPKTYLRRIRLQYAAYYLVWSDASVLQVANLFGFATNSGFTKAFTQLYGVSPNRFRNSKTVVPYLHSDTRNADGFTAESLATNKLVVRIEKKRDQRFALMRHVGDMDGVGRVWKQLLGWAREKRVLNKSSVFVGIHNDYWDQQAQDRYRYDAAISIPDDFEVGNEVNTLMISGGQVASTEFQGTYEEADKVWRRFLEHWLPASGYALGRGYVYDTYPYALVNQSLLSALQIKFLGIKATFNIPLDSRPQKMP